MARLVGDACEHIAMIKAESAAVSVMLTFETGRVEQASRRIDGRPLASSPANRHITLIRGKSKSGCACRKVEGVNGWRA